MADMRFSFSPVCSILALLGLIMYAIDKWDKQKENRDHDTSNKSTLLRKASKDTEEQKVLRNNFSFICENTRDLELLLTHLFQRHIISWSEMERIKSKTTTIGKYMKMYSFIFKTMNIKQQPGQWEHLITSLRDSNNEYIAVRLQSHKSMDVATLCSTNRKAASEKNSSTRPEAVEKNPLLETIISSSYSIHSSVPQVDESNVYIMTKELDTFTVELIGPGKEFGIISAIRVVGTRNGDICGTQILDIISSYQGSVEEIILENIHLKNEKFSRRLFLPKLRKFTLHLAKNFASQKEINEFYVSGVDKHLFGLLFFQKYNFNADHTKCFRDLIPCISDMDIEIIVGKITVLKINENEIVSCSEDTNLLLKELLKTKSKCKSISLTNPHANTISGKNLKFPRLKKLLLYEIPIDNFQDCLKESSLEELRIYISKLDEIDITDLPRSLKEFSCLLGNLIVNVDKISSEDVYFRELKSLVLYNCKYADEVVDNFSNIFHCNDISISFGGGKDNEKTLLPKILNQRKSSFVYIRNFPKEYYGDSLSAKGIFEGDKYFIMQKEPCGSWCMLDNRVSFEMRELLQFELFQLQRFWDYDIFHKKIFFARQSSIHEESDGNRFSILKEIQDNKSDISEWNPRIKTPSSLYCSVPDLHFLHKEIFQERYSR